MATEKKKIAQFVTPTGTAYYAHLFKPAMFEGKTTGYEVSMVFDDAYTEKLKNKLEQELQKAKESNEFKGKRWLKEPFLSYIEKELDDPIYQGANVFKFKMALEGRNSKTGETFKRLPPLFDAAGRPIKDVVSIGNGTQMKICFVISPYHKSATVNGIGLYLLAAQIIDLKEYSPEQTADKFGFEEVEGGFSIDETAGQFDEDVDTDSEEYNEGDF